MRFFHLAEGGVSCGDDGLFVGSAALLRRSGPERGGGWAPLPVAERDEALAEVYGLPIDSAASEGGLIAVARALERGDIALASIGALLLRFPDPPSLSKRAARGSAELAVELAASRLLKADWDPSKHPRLGEPPNPGWFASTDSAPRPALREAPAANLDPASGGRRLTAEASSNTGTAIADPRSDLDDALRPELWTWRQTLQAVREALKSAAARAIKTARFALWTEPEMKVAVEAAIEALTATPLNPDEQRAIDQTNASFDPPKALDELRQRPTRFPLGYERHHIVEQNPANLAKSPLRAILEKFGRAALEDPSNIAWIPRTKHELITAFFNGKDPDGPAAGIRRRLISTMSFEDQYLTGLAVMQLFGVLQ